MKRKTASRLWATWAITGCALEAWTLTKAEQGSTLSANVWDLCHIDRRQPFNEKLRRGVTVGFIVWLPIHWATGGKI
jgi:hypothetical protein